MKRIALDRYWINVFIFKSFGDSGGIQTHDLQNRNLTFYSAELRSHFSDGKDTILYLIFYYLCILIIKYTKTCQKNL